jgi:hypothetical protein
MHFDEGNQGLDNAENLFDANHVERDQGRHALKHRIDDLLKRLNWIQMLADLATLLSTRAESLDQLSDDHDHLHVHMTFADWEACIFALEVLVATSEDYINEYRRMMKRSNEKREVLAILTAMAESIVVLSNKFSCFGEY